jgi:hypothetical protein
MFAQTYNYFINIKYERNHIILKKYKRAKSIYLYNFDLKIATYLELNLELKM